MQYIISIQSAGLAVFYQNNTIYHLMNDNWIDIITCWLSFLTILRNIIFR